MILLELFFWAKMIENNNVNPNTLYNYLIYGIEAGIDIMISVALGYFARQSDDQVEEKYGRLLIRI